MDMQRVARHSEQVFSKLGFDMDLIIEGLNLRRLHSYHSSG